MMRKYRWLAGLLLVAAALAWARKQENPDRAPRGNWPKVVWRESVTEEIQSFYLARRAGQVMFHSQERVWYDGAEGKQVWKMGEGRGWKYIGGGGISWDGQRVLFQTNLEPRRHTNLLDLDVYLVDGAGNLVWVKKNPYRYNTSRLSPSGRFILFGDPFEKTTKVYDQNLNLLWEKEIYLWHVMFDPEEHYLFDSVSGLLFDPQGQQVWDMGRNMRVLALSDDAEVLLAGRFLGGPQAQELFLISRTALKKVPMPGLSGSVSPDGSMFAYATPEHQVRVYRTAELFTAGPELKPLFTLGFAQPLLMNLSRDNRSLFIFGQENQLQWSLILVWIPERKVLWREGVEDVVRDVQVAEDNRFVVFKKDKTTLVKLQSY